MIIELKGDITCGSIEDDKNYTFLISESEEGINSFLEIRVSKESAKEIYECLECTFDKE